MKSNVKLWVASFFLITVFTYGLLVVGDFLLQRYISISNEQTVTEAEALERARIQDEDIPKRSEAIRSGYKPLFYPETIDNYPPLKDLSVKLLATPLAPQPNTNLYFCNEGYGLIKYKTDRLGFRNQDNLWGKKIDVVLIGDSFTHGACVEEDKTIGGQLLKNWTTLNLGSYGNHAIHYAAVEKVFLPVIKPKFAITIFYANDNDDDSGSRIYDAYFINHENYFEDTKQLTLSKNLTEFYKQSDLLIDKLLSGNQPPDEFLKNYTKSSGLKKALKYLKLPTIRKQLKTYLMVLGAIKSLPSSNTLAIDVLQEECNKVGCIPIIAYIPNSSFWREDARSTKYAEALAEYCKVKNIVFIDSTPALTSSREVYAAKGPHLSPLGYEIVSREISAAISKLAKQ